MLNNVTVFSILTYASVNSTCDQPPPPPFSPGLLRGICPPCQSRGGAFANFALPEGRALANPGAIPELLTRRQFPIRIQLHRRFYWKKADWFICQGQEYLEEGCKGMFSILCTHFFFAYQKCITKLELSMWINVFWFNWIKFLLILFEERPFIFIKLFITYNFTALY